MDEFCDIKQIDLNGGVSRFVDTGDCWDAGPMVNPVNGQVAFFSEKTGMSVMSADGTNQRRIPGGPIGTNWPAWSPDGLRLSYNSGGNIWTVRPDGSERRSVTALRSPQGIFRTAHWSIDGSRFFAVAAFGGVRGIYSFAADGSGVPERIALPQGPTIVFLGNVPTNQSAPPVIDPILIPPVQPGRPLILRLQWPAIATNFVLESVGSLGATWVMETPPPIVGGKRVFTTTVEPQTRSRFWRLRRQ